ncbi:hypothetical protein B0H13DRAFT_2319628 [Mycena leptocephala]|nr:hypothetical protein B0H13DRAFT_2319628 [Mycena leptocephala]
MEEEGFGATKHFTLGRAKAQDASGLFANTGQYQHPHTLPIQLCFQIKLRSTRRNLRRAELCIVFCSVTTEPSPINPNSFLSSTTTPNQPPNLYSALLRTCTTLLRVHSSLLHPHLTLLRLNSALLSEIVVSQTCPLFASLPAYRLPAFCKVPHPPDSVLRRNTPASSDLNLLHHLARHQSARPCSTVAPVVSHEPTPFKLSPTGFDPIHSHCLRKLLPLEPPPTRAFLGPHHYTPCDAFICTCLAINVAGTEALSDSDCHVDDLRRAPLLDACSRLFTHTLEVTTAYAPPTSYLCPPSPRVADSA